MSKSLVETREQRSAIDERLLRGARKSIAELSEETGLDPEDIAERMSRLLEDRGWMSQKQEERYMLIELGTLIDDARDRLKTAEDKDWGTIAKIVLGSMTIMGERWDARAKLVDADIERITQSQARIFGEAFDIAQRHLIDGLMMLHSEITTDEITSLSREGLLLAKRELDASVAL